MCLRSRGHGINHNRNDAGARFNKWAVPTFLNNSMNGFSLLNPKSDSRDWLRKEPAQSSVGQGPLLLLCLRREIQLWSNSLHTQW